MAPCKFCGAEFDSIRSASLAETGLSATYRRWHCGTEGCAGDPLRRSSTCYERQIAKLKKTPNPGRAGGDTA